MRVTILAALVLVLVAGCRPAVLDPTPAPVIELASAIQPVETETPPADTPPPTPLGTEPSALAATATPTLTATGTTTTPPTPTRTHTATPEATHTSTSTASPTLLPTRTTTPTATHTPTPRPSATPYPVPSGSISRIDANFKSPSLQLDREVIIYLPPGYDTQTQRRYPVLYLLHGWGGFDLKHTTEWEQWGLMNGVQQAIVSGKVQPMIVVQPLAYTLDGQCSLFFNHGPGTDAKPWGDYIWKDVVTFIDSTYRTIPQRTSRAIGGFSFGGQGALTLALTHPEVFATVGGHSPSFRGADGSISFLNDWNWYNQFDPIWLVENTDHAHQLSIWMDVATGDDKVRNCGQGSDRCVEAFHALLVAKSIPHEWHDTWPGPHEGTYWEGHLGDYLDWYTAHLIGQ